MQFRAANPAVLHFRLTHRRHTLIFYRSIHICLVDFCTTIHTKRIVRRDFPAAVSTKHLSISPFLSSIIGGHIKPTRSAKQRAMLIIRYFIVFPPSHINCCVYLQTSMLIVASFALQSIIIAPSVVKHFSNIVGIMLLISVKTIAYRQAASRHNQINAYKKPSLFSFAFEKAYLYCIKIGNSLNDHTFLAKTLAFSLKMM